MPHSLTSLVNQLRGDDKLNLESLCSLYSLHDSVVLKFSYSFENRCAICVLSFEGDSQSGICSIKFKDILMFKIEAQNVNFIEDELIDLKVNSKDGEYFKAFFSEGFGMPGKVLEISCTAVDIEVSFDKVHEY